MLTGPSDVERTEWRCRCAHAHDGRAMPAAEAAAADERHRQCSDAADGDAAAEAPSPITVRADFNPLAVFAPAVRTDADGHATVDYQACRTT